MATRGRGFSIGPHDEVFIVVATHDERTMAMLAHVLSIFAGFVAPLVIYFVKRRESRFVAFHALQAIFWHLTMMIAMFGTFIVFAAGMFASGGMARHLLSNRLADGRSTGSADDQATGGRFSVRPLVEAPGIEPSRLVGRERC